MFLPKLNGVYFAFWHVLFFKIWPSLGLSTIGLGIPLVSLYGRVSLACRGQGTRLNRNVGHAAWYFLTPAKYLNLSKFLFLHLCCGENNLHHRVIVRIIQNTRRQVLHTVLDAWEHGAMTLLLTLLSLWSPACRAVLKTEEKKQGGWTSVKYLSIFASPARLRPYLKHLAFTSPYLLSKLRHQGWGWGDGEVVGG